MGNRQQALDFINSAVTAINDKTQPSHLQHGYQLLTSAVLADPTYGHAHYQLGNSNSDLNCLPAAIGNWRRALECELTDDERAKTLTNLGWRLHTMGQTEEALAVSLEALRYKPDAPLAYLNLSLIYGFYGDSKKSVEHAEKAFALDPVDVHPEIALAFALLFDGQYARGFRHFEQRFRWRLHNFLHYPYPKWEGEADKTVFLVADQGLGDTLSFSRFVALAAQRAKYIHACVQPELMRLFTHAFRHLPNVNLIPAPAPFPEADGWSTFVSLPSALGLTDEEIVNTPHISCPRVGSYDNWKVPDRKLHIGIAWGGSKLNDVDKHRNIPLVKFLDLYQVEGIQLYSLQVDDRVKELHELGCAALVRDLSSYIRDVQDTVGILAQLDLVITCESALGHIAALAGKECWVPYSYQGRDYRLGLNGEKKLWTPKHRVFQQEPDSRWEQPFTQIVDRLRWKMIHGR